MDCLLAPKAIERLENHKVKWPVPKIFRMTKNNLRLENAANSELISEALRLLGSISSNDLMALEVIWQPEGEGETLRKEELIIQYPNLKHL